jgi:hypothetical protein
VRNYVVDPEGRSIGRVEGQGGGPGQGGGSGRPTGSPTTTLATTTTTVPGDDSSSDVNWWLIGGLVALVAAVGLGIWLLARRRPDATVAPTADEVEEHRTWAQGIVHRLEAEGAVRNRPRRPTESIVDYGTALGTSVLADPRLADASRIVSGALFGRTQPSLASRAWVDTVVSDAIERNPLPEMAGAT